MRVQKTSFLLAAIAALLLSPISALACACCSNTGHYFSGEVELGEHPRSELQRLRVARTAYLYTSEAGIEEDSVGIDRPKTSYTVQGAFAGNVWRLTFRSGTNSGTLELPLPSKMWNHSVDIHDGKLSPGGGPLLYKEWRLEGEIKGSGFFKTGMASPAKYVLVLQGRGNGCDSAGDFGNWRLDVRGEKADYAFYGKLIRSL